MGDQYRPRDGYGHEHPRYEDLRYNDTRHDPRYNEPRYDRNDRYDHYEERGYGGNDRYHERESYGRAPPPPRDNGGYTFRGAAERQQYQPEQDFSFRAPGPRFPPADSYSHPVTAQRSRPIDDARNRHAASERGRGRGRGMRERRERGVPGRGRGAFRSKAAHSRQILSGNRATTPEQLEGMNLHGDTRFRELNSSEDDDSDDSDVIDLTQEDDAGEGGPRKRAKLDVPVEAAAPKWSNPDPYTALPPPESLGAPKKDIVQVIRKAKNDAVEGDPVQNPVQENVDFISLNFDDEFQEDDVSEDSDAMGVESLKQAPLNAPSGPSSFSHRPDLHAVIPSAQATKEPQSTATKWLQDNARGGKTKSAPLDLIPATDEELVDQYLSRGAEKKRKREDGTRSQRGNIIDAWIATNSDPAPWCKTDHVETSSTATRLHKEICDFHDFVRPYEYEEAVRRELITRVQQAIRVSGAKGAYNVDVHCFGSFAAGLYLPTADMDLVAVSKQYMSGGRGQFAQSKREMYRISDHLTRNTIAKPGVNVIAKAKVPIIKFDDVRTDIHVDVSFENDSGLVANKTFQEWKALYPAMPVIVVLIKQMLAMRNLNEVHTGGIGGFTVICLVVSMMQLMPELQSGTMNPRLHYGDLLMEFLDLYGNRFDVRNVGIRMSPPGYFDKVKEPMPKQNSERLTIQDPNNPLNDISGGSAAIDTVLDCFRTAHGALQRRLAQIEAGVNVHGSILGCIWGGNYTSFIQQRAKLSTLHRGYAAGPPPSLPAPAVTSRAVDRKGQHSNRKDTHNAGGPNNSNQQEPQQQLAVNGQAKKRPPPRLNHALPPKPMTQGQLVDAHDSTPMASSTNRDHGRTAEHELSGIQSLTDQGLTDSNKRTSILKHTDLDDDQEFVPDGPLERLDQQAELTNPILGRTRPSKVDKSSMTAPLRKRRAAQSREQFPQFKGVPDELTPAQRRKLHASGQTSATAQQTKTTLKTCMSKLKEGSAKKLRRPKHGNVMFLGCISLRMSDTLYD
ncbi:hypothetical protein LTR62_004133 [Meristemomyces frigidus]|uniref:polynucleotide adenylyltransferase n=1 Tax=Meristemomyces frigidus TaxID=1508187 RepID=A0AAN7YU44_9PEZI|nr:hypothetical protein LTR62_004133 [Meristemomyces frigidus]